MKMEVNADREIVLSEVYNAIGVRVGDGEYGVCERDGHLTIVKDGRAIWNSNKVDI